MLDPVILPVKVLEGLSLKIPSGSSRISIRSLSAKGLLASDTGNFESRNST
jgi:hypothetical protein